MQSDGYRRTYRAPTHPPETATTTDLTAPGVGEVATRFLTFGFGFAGMVEAHLRLVDDHGIGRLHAAIGGSTGGFMARSLATRYRLVEIHSDWGHDAFLVEPERFAGELRRALEGGW